MIFWITHILACDRSARGCVAAGRNHAADLGRRASWIFRLGAGGFDGFRTPHQLLVCRMKALSPARPWITTPQVTELLEALYADAATNDPMVHQRAEESGTSGERAAGFYQGRRKAYMAVDSEFGHLLYNLARSAGAKTVVEFGTSFGVSTIFLAAAIRDNGGGKVITTEFDPEKAERAKKNLTAAGLNEWVEFRVGDALETLSDPPREIDMVFLDGAKGLYLDVLKLLEPHLRSAGIIASDNTDHDGMEAFLDYIRIPGNGYTSAAIVTGGQRSRGHEITIRH
jgi:predicted O-methyltransferase YrrM